MNRAWITSRGWAALFLAPLFAFAQMIGPAPDQRLTPAQVVEIVVNALLHNNSPLPNAGIYTAYRFASPANHAVTGPYGRFLRTVKTPGFAPMLGNNRAEFGATTSDRDHASETVQVWTADGKPVAYRWDLSLQQDGPYRGCWMVDGVSSAP
jgi:Domain of unknown function (DUF4864)